MAARYDALVAKVRDWVNRDAETLPNSIIIDALDYAADTIYRELRIPALEASFQYGIEDVINTSSSASLLATLPFDVPDDTSVIPVPQDLSEFISIKLTSGVIGQSGGITRAGADIVINEKADLRTFEDFYSERYDFYVWTRKGNYIMFRPGNINRSSTGVIELFYYRRLPDLDARFDVTAANQNAGNNYLTEVDDDNPIPTDLRTSAPIIAPALGTLWRVSDTATTWFDTQALAEAARAAGNTDPVVSTQFFGNEPTNWLRDQNEKAVLFGALYQCFDYLGEDQMSQKYLQKAVQEVQQLNAEEGQRRNSGGNQQVNFNGLNLI